jgi:hypothetical protein
MAKRDSRDDRGGGRKARAKVRDAGADAARVEGLQGDAAGGTKSVRRAAREAEREARSAARELQRVERRLVEAQAIFADAASRADALAERVRALSERLRTTLPPRSPTDDEGAAKVPPGDAPEVASPSTAGALGATTSAD